MWPSHSQRRCWNLDEHLAKNTLHGLAILAKLGTQEMFFNYHWPQLSERYFAVFDCFSLSFLIVSSFSVFLKLCFSESGKHFLFLPSLWLSHFSLPYNSCLGSSCHPPMHVSSPAEWHYSVFWLRPKTGGGHHSTWRMEDWRTKEVRTKLIVVNTQAISKVWSQQVIQIWTGETVCILIFIHSLSWGLKTTLR